MKTIFIQSIMLVTCVLFTQILLGHSQTLPKVLLIAFDGMRWDYINPELTPFIWSLAQSGVFAPQGISDQMITLTAPNFFSIATGLYEENHGIIGNYFFDPYFQTYFDYFGGFTGVPSIELASRDARWYNGEPIWQTNENAGNNRSSGAMRWPMCDSKINNITMKNCAPFGEYFTYDEWKQQIDTLVGWFTQENPINLGLFYNPQPDDAEHAGDIYRQEVQDIIGQLDNLTAYLFDQLKQKNLLDSINIILTADHGHVNVDIKSVITLEDIIGDDIILGRDVIISQNSLFPQNNITTEILYDRLMKYRNRQPKFDVYLKAEIPDEWHYKNNDRIGPILVIEKLGYRIIDKAHLSSMPVIGGQHGFSKHYPEMRPFFVATGPAFKPGYQLPPAQITSVDIYPLIAYLLNVSTPVVDGRLENIASILLNPPDLPQQSSTQPTQSTTTSAGENLTSGMLSILFMVYLMVF